MIQKYHTITIFRPNDLSQRDRAFKFLKDNNLRDKTYGVVLSQMSFVSGEYVNIMKLNNEIASVKIYHLVMRYYPECVNDVFMSNLQIALDRYAKAKFEGK